MLKKVTHIIVLLLAIIFTTTSCQKFNEKTYEDYNFIQLKYDMDVDFSKYKTFAIVDTINIISDTIYNGEGGYPDFNIDMDGNTDGEYSKQIIENIRENMTRFGLTELPQNSKIKPDLNVSITSMTLKQVSRYTWFPNNSYYPWWGNGYWNNNYTWGVSAYYTSNNGLLSIDIFDVLFAMLMDNEQYESK
jgi:hypothetical protein